jgi:carbonic anhydrase
MPEMGGQALERKVRCHLKKGLTRFVLLVVAEVLVPAGSRAQWKTPWSYEGATGAEHWGDLDPEYAACNAGKEQSPIDIRNAEHVDLPALRFEYRSGPLKYLINNGYTIRVNYHDAPGGGNFLIAGGQRYQLKQFHFHRPSEEYVQGKPYDMVVHLMHESSDGKVAGVAVLLKAGRANATIQRIWEHMPKTRGKEEEIAGVEVDPAGLLPSDTAYYTYVGSLTAPPCSEGVTWFVVKTPVEISPEQINAFAELYPHDVRPVQPLNGRVVKESR